ALYPSLEVRGTLQLPKVTRPSDHPVPLNFTPEDVDRALQGELITKVIVLEHPDQAIPEVSTPNLPLEIDGGRDPLAEARVRGRPVLIIRLGGRDMPVDDLQRQGIAGTVLLPGDRMLPPPAVPPYMPWACFPMIDPLAGPKPPE